MPVPPEIRAVPRPKNTIVEDRGRDGPKRFAVRERGAIKWIPGKNPQPHNGKVIGHIINGAFVALANKPNNQSPIPDMLSYGSAALIKAVSADLLRDLLQVYDPAVAYTIMSIAAIKVIRPGTTAERMPILYNRTFISIFYPGIALSPNAIGRLYSDLGSDWLRRKGFYQRRISSTAEDHHILIAGILKQEASEANDLSSYSHKEAKNRSPKDRYLVYAFNLERMEPLCAEIFPGTCIDPFSYASLIRDNDIKAGVIIADSGFQCGSVKDGLPNRLSPHYLRRVKGNDPRIANNEMLSLQGVLEHPAGKFHYSKKQISADHFLYAFRDAELAVQKKATRLTGAEKSADSDNDNNNENDSQKGENANLVIFESDFDLDPLTVYQGYWKKRLLELIFQEYKSDECRYFANDKDDSSATGAAFVNFIAATITARIVKLFEDSGLLKNQSYADVMDDLSSAWRKRSAPLALPQTQDEFWVHTDEVVFDVLAKLDLCTPRPKEEVSPKRRGRPPEKEA